MRGVVSKVTRQFKAGDTVYALYYGPRRDKDPRWVPAVIKKALGTRSFNVKVIPRGPVWRRHLEQLQPRFASEEDEEPGDIDFVPESPAGHLTHDLSAAPPSREPSLPPSYGPNHPRRSGRSRKPRVILNL